MSLYLPAWNLSTKDWESGFLLFSIPLPTFHTHVFEKLKGMRRCQELLSSVCSQARPSVPMAAWHMLPELFFFFSHCRLSDNLSGSPNCAVNGWRAGLSPFSTPGWAPGPT